MKKSFILLLSFLFTMNSFYAQGVKEDKEKYVSSDYKTSSLTNLIIEFAKYPSKRERKFKNIFKEIDLTTKYFNNPISWNLIPSTGEKKLISSFDEEMKKYGESKSKMNKFRESIAFSIIGNKGLLLPKDSIGLSIKDFLEKKNIGAEIMQIWAQKDKQGNFVVLNKRAQQSLNTNDIRDKADYHKLDVFKDLFKRNYILVFDFGEIYSGPQYSDKFPLNGGATISQAQYAVEANTYIYKVDIDDNKFNQLKTSFGRGNLKNIKFPIKYVGRFLSVAQAGDINDAKETNYDSFKKQILEDKVYLELAQNAYDQIIEIAEMRIEDFKLRTQVKEGFPNKIKAEVGLKENIKVDQRYFVYQYEFNPKTNKLESKLVGVVRASAKIADNKDNVKDEKGEFKTTKFNQIWGKPIKEGMFMVQENDFGIGLGIGFRTVTSINLNFRIEYNISKWIKKSWKGSPLVGSNVFMDIFPASVTIGEQSEIKMAAGMGVSTKFYINKWIKPEPYIGYYLLDDTKFLQFGLRFEYPLKYNIFLDPEIGIGGGGEDINNFILGLNLKYEL